MSTAQSIQTALYERLNRAPRGRAVAFYASDGSYNWQSFASLYEEAARLAVGLERQGLDQGDACVIVLPNKPFTARTILAVLLKGAVPVLVAPPVVQGSLLDLPKILRHTVRTTEAPLVICDTLLRKRRETLEADHENVRFIYGEEELSTETVEADLTPVDPAPTDVAALQLTSGTTGFPRICTWSQEAVLAALDGMAAAMDISSEDTCFNWTPFYHDMGLVNNFLLCLTYDVPLVLSSPHDFVKRPALWLNGLSDTHSTISWSPNFGYAITAQRARDSQLEGVRLDHVRALWNAAERIHFDTIQDFYERFSSYGLSYEALKANFGCAENIGGATFTALDEPVVVERVDRERLYEDQQAQPVAEHSNEAVDVVSAGRPHPDLEVYILSETGERLPEGQVGEVTLDTPSRMIGYMNDPEATNAAFEGKLLRTGDLGYVRDDNLFWVGRAQERITVRGKKIDPSDFEPVLFDVDGLREGCFVVFGVDDAQRGTQRIILISEVRVPVTRTLDEIKEDIREQTFMRMGVTVDTVQLVEPDTLTKTSSGKRRHRHFRELYVNNELDQFFLEDASELVSRPT